MKEQALSYAQIVVQASSLPSMGRRLEACTTIGSQGKLN